LPRSNQNASGSAPAASPAPVFSVDYISDSAETLPLTAALVLSQIPPSFVLGSDMQLSSGSAAAGAPAVGDQSDQAVRADTARAAFGITGAGVKVGILSDSFDVLGGAAADAAAGNLPPGGVQVLAEGPAGSHDEGRAMAELVHRIAPDATLLFHTATAGEASFAAGIDALVAAGCKVIVDDVAYLDEPFFQQSGPIDTAVQNAIAAGANYFTAAGNQGNDYIQLPFAALHLALPGLPAGAAVQDFGTAAAPQPWLDVTVPAGGRGLFDLQWDQPYGDSADSLGLALFDAHGNLLATASADTVGGVPDQVLSWTNTAGLTGLRLVLYMNGGVAPPGVFKLIAYGNGGIDSPYAGSGSGSVIGHEMVPGANTVGAMAWSASPRFGGSDTPESFSSVGTGSFLLGPDGTKLAQPQSTQKVDFLAPDGSMTSTLAPFYGTSAAAANAAGVAALVAQADPLLTPAGLTQVLDATASPAVGGALATGAGLLDANAAVQLALSLGHGAA
jgi:hypothetical protein